MLPKLRTHDKRKIPGVTLQTIIFSRAIAPVKQMEKSKAVLLGITLLCLAGCSAAPNRSEIEGAVIKHFEAKHYKVVELKIGSVHPVPISAKTYMGTPGYVIDVPSLTLQSVNTKENTGNYRKEKRVTFSNAHILIQQRTGPDKGWIITNISGISVP